MGKLDGKVAIVSGSSQGIGEATARLFAQEGAQVIVADINYEKAKIVADSINAQLYETISPSLPIHLDVTNRESVNNMIKQVIEQCGRIDILVNNAGITKDDMIHRLNPEDFDKVIAVNLTGVFNCTQATVPHMISQKYGRIINMSSVVGIQGSLGLVGYSASKAAVIGMTKTLGKELARHGITCNAIAPGYCETSILDVVSEKVINALKDKTPLKRLGRPEEIAKAALYLASDEASFCTASVLSIDGGIVL